MDKIKHSLHDLKKDLEEHDESFSQLYKIDSLIGQGAFGIVLSCLDIQKNSQCAVKV